MEVDEVNEFLHLSSAEEMCERMNTYVSSSTVKSFKVRLDRFWANEEIYYNYKTNISCTGSRSNYDIDLE